MVKEFKAGDTPRITASLLKDVTDIEDIVQDEPLGLGDATVRIYVQHTEDGVLVVNDEATIEDEENGDVSYVFSPGQVSRTGEYEVEFVAEWEDGGVLERRKTWPVEGFEALESHDTVDREQDVDEVEANQDLELRLLEVETVESDEVLTDRIDALESEIVQVKSSLDLDGNDVSNVGQFDGQSVSTESASVATAPSDSTDVARFEDVPDTDGLADDPHGNDAHSEDYIPDAERGVGDGVAELNDNATLRSGQTPDLAITETHTVADESERLALDVEEGDIAIQQDESRTYIFTGGDPSSDGDWSEIANPDPPVDDVFGRTGSIDPQQGDYADHYYGEGDAAVFDDLESTGPFDLGPDDGQLGQLGGGGNQDMWWWVRNDSTYGNRMGFLSGDSLRFEAVGYDISFAVNADGSNFGTGTEALRIHDSDGRVTVRGDDVVVGDEELEIQVNGTDGDGIINFKTE